MLDGKITDLLKVKISLFLLISTIYLLFASGVPWLEADCQLKKAMNLVKYHALSVKENPCGIDIMSIDNRWYDQHGITNILFMVPIAYSESFFNKFDVKNINYFLSTLGALTGIIVDSLTCLVFFSILKENINENQCT